MNFVIQTSTPQSNNQKDIEDEKLSEAIQTVFPMMTEDAFIIWNTIYIPLNYKYDVSIIIDDVLQMLNKILYSENGSYHIVWPSNTFRCDWHLAWNQCEIRITSEWESVLGHTENLLNQSNTIELETMQFVYEWKKLLEVVIFHLNKCGYNENDLYDFKQLLNLNSAIKEYGLLYKKS